MSTLLRQGQNRICTFLVTDCGLLESSARILKPNNLLHDMQRLIQLLFATALVLSVVCSPSQALAKSKIQLAILLDSSNSMDGLIDQTRMQLWSIVNSLAKVTKDNETPELQVALYHYGNDGLPATTGHVQKLTEFTTNLDLVSEKLFSIRTNGGEEYVGWSLRSAMQELDWSKNKEDFRVVFVAGNEPFDQGPVAWKDSVNLALKSDVFVNTIFCGDAENSERKLWSAGALLGKGSNFSINQNEQVAVISSPYDQQIVELNEKLNATYVPYGRQGGIGRQRQSREDQNQVSSARDRASNTANVAIRSSSKVTSYYRSSSWDLVDAIEDKVVKLEDVATSDLPTEMQRMTLAEKRQYIQAKKTERTIIRKKIGSLSQLREAYVAQQRRLNPTSNKTVDSVIIQSLQSQLATKRFKMK
jgi:von Willebrand factor type A domain